MYKENVYKEQMYVKSKCIYVDIKISIYLSKVYGLDSQVRLMKMKQNKKYAEDINLTSFMNKYNKKYALYTNITKIMLCTQI